MGINVQCSSYADFQLVVDSQPFKVGNVFYKFTVGGGFFVVAVAVDLSSSIGASQNTMPGSFATDYPNAIQLTDTAPIVGNNFSSI